MVVALLGVVLVAVAHIATSEAFCNLIALCGGNYILYK